MRLLALVHSSVVAATLLFSACSHGGPGGSGDALGIGGAGEWHGVVSCMHLTGADTRSYAGETSLDASATTATVTLSGVSVSQPGYDCIGLRLDDVANGAGSTASRGFKIDKQDAACTDDLDGEVSVSGQGFIIGDRLQLTLFLHSNDATHAVQCFYMLDR